MLTEPHFDRPNAAQASDPSPRSRGLRGQKPRAPSDCDAARRGASSERPWPTIAARGSQQASASSLRQASQAGSLDLVSAARFGPTIAGRSPQAAREQEQRKHRLAALLRQAGRARRAGEFMRYRALIAESDRLAAEVGRVSMADVGSAGA